MRDLKKYWQDVNALEQNLPEFVWMVPQKGPVALVEVKAAVAAKLLHAGSHRQATDEELDAHRDAQQSQRRKAFRDDLRRKGIAVVPVSED